MWLVFALLAAVFAALVAIFGKMGLGGVDTTLATTVRAFCMFVLLLAVSFATGKLQLVDTLSSKSLKYILLSGVAGALSWLAYFAALRLGLASRVAAVDRLSVVFVVILAALFLGEALTLKAGIGAFLIALGAMLLVF